MKHIPETPPQIIEFPRAGFRELYLLEDTFSAGIFLLTGISKEGFNEWLKEHFSLTDPDESECNGFHNWYKSKDGSIYNVIVIHKEWTWGRAQWGTLVHELHHAVTNILTRKGIKHSTETEEVWAYLQASLLERFIWGLNHRRRILHRPKPRKKRTVAKKKRKV